MQCFDSTVYQGDACFRFTPINQQGAFQPNADRLIGRERMLPCMNKKLLDHFLSFHPVSAS
jgi:hypothetical protein